MRSASWNVTNWEFTPDASSETGASLPIVRERSTSREWAGIAAIGGVVKAYVTNGVEQRTFQARITVTAASAMRKGLRRGGPRVLWLTEAPVGIEPTNGGFADLCLTTWLRRRGERS
jgi:hypothetical protein